MWKKRIIRRTKNLFTEFFTEFLQKIQFFENNHELIGNTMYQSSLLINQELIKKHLPLHNMRGYLPPACDIIVPQQPNS